MPFLHITTRIDGMRNDDLLRKYGGTAFPTVMYLDAEGRRIMRHSGPRTVGGFEDSFEEVRDFLKLVEKAEGGDAKAATEAFIRQLELEWFEIEEARTRRAALEKVSSKQEKRIAQLLIDTEVRTVARGAGRDAAARQAAGKHFREMLEEKQVPENPSQLYSFWTMIADHAEAQKDRKLFKKAVAYYDKTLGDDHRYRRTLKMLEERLKNFPK